jgi:hypothetical protein
MRVALLFDSNQDQTNRKELTMKSMICRAALVSLLVGLAAAVSGNAQVATSFIFNAPFQFVAGDAVLPPGKYVVRTAEEGNTVLEIIGVDTKASALLNVEPTQSPKTPNKSEVIFKNYGNDHVLSEVWEQGNNTGAMVTKARFEQRYEKKGGTPTKQSLAATKQ